MTANKPALINPFGLESRAATTDLNNFRVVAIAAQTRDAGAPKKRAFDRPLDIAQKLDVTLG